MPMNVLPFKQPQRSSAWGVKLYAALAYLLVAYLLTLDQGASLNFLLVLAFLYWFFIHRQLHQSRYFSTNRTLLMILGTLLLLFGLYAFFLPTAAILLLLGAYWVLISRAGQNASYFLRYHLLSNIVLNVTLWFLFTMIFALLGFLGSFLNLGNELLGNGLLSTLTPFLVYTKPVVIWGFGIFLAFSALTDRTPRIPFVSANVRYWA